MYVYLNNTLIDYLFSYSELNRKLEPVDITSEFTGLPSWLNLHIIKFGNIIFLKITVRTTAVVGSYSFNIPDKYASINEQYIVEYHNTEQRKAYGYVNGNIIRLYILTNSQESYLSVSYPIASS